MKSPQNHKSSSYDLSPMGDINITPFVDIMLVLLVIFMVAAPMLEKSIDLNLPSSQKGDRGKALAPTDFVISLNKKGQLYIGEKKILRQHLLKEMLTLKRENKREAKITKWDKAYVRADVDVPYGEVAALISLLKRQGFEYVGLVTE